MSYFIKAYLASGWFTDEQEKVRNTLRRCMDSAGITYYSPKEDGLFVQGKTDPYTIFMENIYQIELCDVIVVSTEGKDMGTIFECGYAYAKRKPLIYYWEGKGPFNLMLAESAFYVATNPTDLVNYLSNSKEHGLKQIMYKGNIE